MKVEYAAIKESLESLGHLTTSIRRLRLALLKVISAQLSDIDYIFGSFLLGQILVVPILQVKESSDTEKTERKCEVAIANILVEATHLKTALGISIPISWSAESDMESVSDGESSCERTDSVSAAGFEMVELVILAADIMKEQHH